MGKGDTGVVDIHGKAYKTVALRVSEFRQAHPNYTIASNVVVADDEKVVIKTEILDESSRVISTGFAEEVRSASRINKTSAFENAETSAVGRALAFFGLAGSEIASADEVAGAINQQKSQEAVEHLVKHNQAMKANFETIFNIKEGIKANDPYKVLENLQEISEEDQQSLWIASTKGGVFTTEERAYFKTDEFHAIRKGAAA
jgi:hypothetical protein